MNSEIQRIAIFEENDVDRFIFERTLKHLPFACDSQIFKTPDEGLHNAHQMRFDIVIIHLNFWGNNYGFKILEEMKKLASNNPVFIATCSYLPGDEIEPIMAKGFSGAFEKAVIFNKLESILSKFTDGELVASKYNNLHS